MSEVKRIFVMRKGGGVGDLLCTLPALRGLREKYPQAEILYALPPEYMWLVRDNRDFRALSFSHDRFYPQWLHRFKQQEEQAGLAFDLWIDLWGPETDHERASDHRTTRTRIESFCEYCRVTPSSLVPVYRVSEAEQKQARHWLAARANWKRGGPTVGLVLRTKSMLRNWPHWERLAELFQDCNVVGIDAAATVKGAIEATGMEPWQAAAVLGCCDAVVAPDTGFLHLAAAAGVPCVGLFGPIHPQARAGVYPTCKTIWKQEVGKDVGCDFPCWQLSDRCVCDTSLPGRCMTGIEPEEVAEAVREMLKEGARGEGRGTRDEGRGDDCGTRSGTDRADRADRTEEKQGAMPAVGIGKESVKDEGGRMKDEAKKGASAPTSSFILHPSSLPSAGTDILFVSDHVYPNTIGGAEISMHLLLQHISRSIYLGSSGGYSCKYHSESRLVGGAEDVRKAIEEVKPRAVFTQLKQGPNAVRVARECGIPCFLFLRSAAEHFCDVRENGRHCCRFGGQVQLLTCSRECEDTNLVLKANREAFETADVVVCNSEYTRAAVERFFRAKTVIVSYPLIQQHEGHTSRQVIVVVRPNSGKGLEVLRAVAAAMPEERFLAVGATHKRFAAENVEWIADQRDMGPVWSRAKLLLKPVWDVEAFGRTIPEAGLWGVPAVATDIGGIAEAMGGGGVTLPYSEDAEPWIVAIRMVLGAWESFSEAARDNAKRFWDVSSVEAQLKAQFATPAAKAAPPAEQEDRTHRTNLTDRTDRAGKVTCLSTGCPGVQNAFEQLALCFPQVGVREFELKGSYERESLVILGAWHAQYRQFCSMHRGVRKAVLLCSSLAQIELSNELSMVTEALQLLRQGDLDYVLFSDRQVAELFAGRNADRVLWLPVVMNCDLSWVRPVPMRAGIHVDLFCPGAPRKNIYCQMAAAKMAGATVHVNSMLLRDKRYAAFAAAIGLPLVDHGLPIRQDYLRLVAGMTCGLQCGFAESFNFVAAEHMALGVPVITSTASPATAGCDGLLRVTNETDPAEIAVRIRSLAEPKARAEAGAGAKAAIRTLCEEHRVMAEDVLRRMVE